jgi:hypothetical protein
VLSTGGRSSACVLPVTGGDTTGGAGVIIVPLSLVQAESPIRHASSSDSIPLCIFIYKLFHVFKSQ